MLAAILALLGFAAWRRRKGGARPPGDFGADWTRPMPRVSRSRPPGSRRAAATTPSSSRSPGRIRLPISAGPRPGDRRFGDTGELKSHEDTLSSESAVNLDQGDPLAEADFHMAYGLYDQAADLVRIALEREPERRDLRMKLLEIYFVWGNKDAFLQTAKASRRRATARRPASGTRSSSWASRSAPTSRCSPRAAGSGRGAGALVDLNLEGGENHVDIDLFGEPGGRAQHPRPSAAKDERRHGRDRRIGGPARSSGLDFMLDAPERGADESPTREMPPRDEPTVEAELMNFADAPTTESPALKTTEMRDRSRRSCREADQTAEVSIDDLGLDLDELDETGSRSADGICRRSRRPIIRPMRRRWWRGSTNIRGE